LQYFYVVAVVVVIIITIIIIVDTFSVAYLAKYLLEP